MQHLDFFPQDVRIKRIEPDTLDAKTGMMRRDWQAFVTRQGPWAQRVVYDRASFLAMSRDWFDIRSVTPGAYGWQTGVLLARPT